MQLPQRLPIRFKFKYSHHLALACAPANLLAGPAQPRHGSFRERRGYVSTAGRAATADVRPVQDLLGRHAAIHRGPFRRQQRQWCGGSGPVIVSPSSPTGGDWMTSHDWWRTKTVLKQPPPRRGALRAAAGFLGKQIPTPTDVNLCGKDFAGIITPCPASL